MKKANEFVVRIFLTACVGVGFLTLKLEGSAVYFIAFFIFMFFYLCIFRFDEFKTWPLITLLTVILMCFAGGGLFVGGGGPSVDSAVLVVLVLFVALQALLPPVIDFLNKRGFD